MLNKLDINTYIMVCENCEKWIDINERQSEDGDSEGFYDTEALVNHFVNVSKAELIEKACEWLVYDLCCYDENYRGIDSGNSLIEDFKKAMEI